MKFVVCDDDQDMNSRFAALPIGERFKIQKITLLHDNINRLKITTSARSARDVCTTIFAV